MAEQFCRRFSLDQIRLATRNFSDVHLIGSGGFGDVYIALISDGEHTVAAAVKKMLQNSKLEVRRRQFVEEIEAMKKGRHANLVPLIGFCDERDELIIICEFIARGTLAKLIHEVPKSKSSNRHSLSWERRLRICIGAAQGLDYLHTECPTIHRDIKSDNILVDEDFNARVSDFGLARHLIAGNSDNEFSANVRGTPGYWDPTSFYGGRIITRKIDVYAFGVVLSEVLSGRPAVDLRLEDFSGSLASWAREKIDKGKFDEMLASNLRGQISKDSLKTFLGLVRRCLDLVQQKRPTMGEVVVGLQLALTQQEKGLSKLSGSRAMETEDSDKEFLETLPIAVPVVPLSELNDITSNFSSVCLIDERSNANVYRGVLKTGQDVVIYRLLSDRRQSHKMFLGQVSMISLLKHKNLVQLHGYCVDGDCYVLAFEYPLCGSLHDALHGVSGSQPVGCLSWEQRVRVAFGVGRALDYIHKKGLVICNIKSSTVLLYDDGNVAKLAYFGLTTDSSNIDCNSGYLAPECIVNGESMTWRTDVYSFGVLLVELLTGRKAVDRQDLVDWMLDNPSVHDVVDARLEGDYITNSVENMARLAVKCISYEAANRPTMREIMTELVFVSYDYGLFSRFCVSCF